jgi:hypothetical protein
MSLQRSLRLVGLLFVLLLQPLLALAQDCPPADRSSWANGAQICANLADRQACYAAGSADLTRRDNAPPDELTAPGTTGIVSALKSITLSPDGLFAFTTAAHLKKDDVTVVLFGSVSLEDRRSGKYVAPATPAPEADTGVPGFTLQAVTWFDGTVLNSSPSIIAPQSGTIPKDITVTIDGRSGQGSQAYVHVTAPDGTSGWTSAPMFNLPDGSSADTSLDFNKLPIIASPAASQRTGPFSRMTFTGSPCPASGMVIQSPKDGDHARFTLNGHMMVLGSTIYVYMDKDGRLVYVTLEGFNYIFTDDGVVVVPAGSQVRIAPDGTVGEVEPYDPGAIFVLPEGLLPIGVAPPTPLTPEQINASPEAPYPGAWSLQIFNWQQSGDCPYPPGTISAVGDFYQEYEWNGDPSQLIDYWTSGQAQAVASDYNVHFDFSQPTPGKYVFTATPNDTDSIQVTFTHPSQSFIAIFASLHTGSNCVVSAQGLLIGSGP